MRTQKTCLECRKKWTPRQYNADFCGTKCKATFHNRRAKRGAALYDAIMLGRLNQTPADQRALVDRVEAVVQLGLDDNKKGKRTFLGLYAVKTSALPT